MRGAVTHSRAIGFLKPLGHRGQIIHCRDGEALPYVRWGVYASPTSI